MLDDPRLQRLAPYARAVLARARLFALTIHADEVGPEHVLCALMEDEDCAAHRAVLHAFADPETIREETLALASGILVSGSVASLPFSPGGVRALRRARSQAAGRGDAAVVEAHLLRAAVRELPTDARGDLEQAGWSDEGLGNRLGRGGAAAPVAAEGGLFRHFTEDGKRALSAAARAARQDRASAIGPAHLLLACLTGDPSLGADCGVSAARARIVLRGRTHDESAVEERPIAADEALEVFLDGMPAGATSLGLLTRFHAGGTPELAQLLDRHKVTPALVERVLAAFEDP